VTERDTAPPQVDTRPEDEALLALLERVFERRFGPKAWGRVTACVQDGRVQTWEMSETRKR